MYIGLDVGIYAFGIDILSRNVWNEFIHKKNRRTNCKEGHDSSVSYYYKKCIKYNETGEKLKKRNGFAILIKSK